MRDVNDTGFKLVLGRTDWRDQFGVPALDAEGDGSPPAVVYAPQDRCVALRPLTERFSRETDEPALEPSDRTTAARDRYGSWYWIDPADPTRIVVRSVGDGAVSRFWPPGPERGEDEEGRRDEGTFRPAEPEDPSAAPVLGGLTITSDHRLVVGAKSPPQLLVFDLHAGGPPHRIPWPGGTPFAPRDASPRPNGGLFLLTGAESEEARIWALDHTLSPASPAGPGPTASPFRPVGATDDSASSSSDGRTPPAPLPAALRPHAIETLPDDTVLVLSGTTLEGDDRPTVYRYHPSEMGTLRGPLGRVDLDAELAPDAPPGEEGPDGDGTWADWRAHDVAFVPGTAGVTELVRGTLYVVGADGNQAYALHLTGVADDLTVRMVPEYLPLRRFTGKGLVAADGTVYYDLTDRWVPLSPQRRSRFVEDGQITSAPFDSEITGCTWHRLFVDACIPVEASVQVESRASDHVERLSDQPWQSEPALYQRDTGSEVPYHDAVPVDTSDPGAWGTWELLLQHAEGRYLQLRLTLNGDGRTTPRLRALRVYAPRFSYLDEYMPDLYQEDEASAAFVERFLANAEGTLTALEGKIAQVKALFDVRTVPDEYLEWLATWFGASFDPALDARRKRLFLDHAVELFNQRGTLAGLARMLRLVLDPCADESLFTPAGIADVVGRPEDATDQTARRSGIRLVEEFAARNVPRAVAGDARAPQQPSEVRVDQPWTYRDGADTLHRRFRAFLETQREEEGERRAEAWPQQAFPPLLPATAASDGSDAAQKRRTDWRAFVRRGIEGPYAAIDADTVQRRPGDRADAATRRFRSVLRRRYATFEQLPAAFRDGADRFEDVQLPQSLPTGDALRDWMQFVGTVLPLHRAAHRFRVLVPVDPDSDVDAQRRRLDVARRVVAEQKPSHTAFEVLPYWAAFRVGAVRTGLDTVLGKGSRYAPLLVGEGALAEEGVGAAHPENVPDRRVVGRDASDAARPL